MTTLSPVALSVTVRLAADTLKVTRELWPGARWTRWKASSCLISLLPLVLRGGERRGQYMRIQYLFWYRLTSLAILASQNQEDGD